MPEDGDEDVDAEPDVYRDEMIEDEPLAAEDIPF